MPSRRLSFTLLVSKSRLFRSDTKSNSHFDLMAHGHRMESRAAIHYIRERVHVRAWFVQTLIKRYTLYQEASAPALSNIWWVERWTLQNNGIDWNPGLIPSSTAAMPANVAPSQWGIVLFINFGYSLQLAVDVSERALQTNSSVKWIYAENKIVFALRP